MSGPVDVLAVLDEFVVVVGDEFGNDPAVRLREVRAAVAELIEATDCLTDAIASDPGYREDILKGLRPLERDSFVSAINRTRAALARVGGAA